MAGKPGRSGGARIGAGRRPDATSRKTRAKRYQTSDPDEFLRALMQDTNADMKDRLTAALALQRTTPAAPQGKKVRQQEAADGVVQRSLAPCAAPTKVRGHLRVVK